MTKVIIAGGCKADSMVRMYMENESCSTYTKAVKALVELGWEAYADPLARKSRDEYARSLIDTCADRLAGVARRENEALSHEVRNAVDEMLAAALVTGALADPAEFTAALREVKVAREESRAL